MSTSCHTPASATLTAAGHHGASYICLIFLLFTFPLTSGLYAQDLTDFRVNDDPGIAEQGEPRIAVAPDGSFVVVWRDKRNSNSDIFIQRFDSAGTAVGRNFRINDDNNLAHQADPALAGDFSGRYLTAWLDYREYSYPNSPGIYCQPLDTGLAPIDTNFNLVTDSSFKDAPDLSLSAWGKGIVVWADNRNNDWDIWGQMLDSDGNPIGDNFLINDDGAGNEQHAPRVSSSALGWFVVAWYDNRLGNDDIFVQRFDSSGTPIGSNFKINTDIGSKRQVFPDVATDGAGRFTVVWMDYRNGNYPDNPDIYSARFDTNYTPLTGNIRMNTDGTNRPQRFPVISADRMGNVAVIWADSVGTSWDIIGQMIDADGEVREMNFYANAEIDSTQTKPDVTLDGRNRYVTWVDRRNGQYDIYASVTKYNEPLMVAIPEILEFEMRQGGPLPDPQHILVDHGGYNSIEFEARSFSPWITVNPFRAITPDSIAVSIATDTLPQGTYFGAVRIIDPMVTDSTIVIPVELKVQSAVLSVSRDTIRFTAPAGYDTSLANSVTITNTGLGLLDWTATDTVNWLSLSDTVGSAPATLEISVSPLNLPVGEYTVPVAIEAGVATNSPDTLWVVFDVRDDLPVIDVAPRDISVTISTPQELDTALTLLNLGGGDLQWTLDDWPSWLDVNRNAGGNSTPVQLTANDNLTEGVNSTILTFTDSAAFNIRAGATLSITYEPIYIDTISISSLVLLPDSQGVIAIAANLDNQLTRLVLPLLYDPTLVTINAVKLGPNLPLHMNRSYRVEPSQGIVLFEISRTPPDTFMAAGQYLLAEMTFTAGSNAGLSEIDTLHADTLYPLTVTFEGSEMTPVIRPGSILIDQATEINEPEDLLPENFILRQNFPNPFNLETTIGFELPNKAHVKLAVYNVLGREVAVLAERSFPAGSHLVGWNGLSDRGEEAPSGVYFYRLQAEDVSLVAKMLLLK